ncbi:MULTISPECIES: fasciclin domain-containing protein [Fischerella]|uniref:Beta-Ig-H3/fasciclin n=1 Tax=Fischerella muscicola CCMEE 5323 TaxID=2019572 RepID=A0A2N6K5V1_FISMU|nr:MULTISPECIES: fasciclin domain-containing protein [Fischerella]MBD2433889.1 fasciclin domain-containing protein [Fischerella sp. FACHB-380]PLZ92058.1 beta-Ig-H3/fasciclin [Fischerella muscicola CCMEE 5323]
MKANKGILRKALFSIVGVGSLFALSACGQPNAENTTPSAQTPTENTSPVAEVTPTTTAPATQTPAGTTANKNFAELAQAAASQGSFKILTQATKAAGLEEQLTAQGPYTVFAPTDAAFNALPQGTLENLLKPENKQQLVQLLTYHVIPGQVTSSQLTSGDVKTVEGTPVTIDVNSTARTISVNGAKVTQADILASNGVVHVVDKVILPPNFQVSPTSSSSPN